MTAEPKRHLLLPPTMTPTEHLEQAVASTSAPTMWVRGSAGERTRLPGKDPVMSGGIQIQIALPIVSEPQEVQVIQPPPPPQVLFRAREVIGPPPASQSWDVDSHPPGSVPSDPVDAPPGLVDMPPGLEEEEPPHDDAVLHEAQPDHDEPEQDVEQIHEDDALPREPPVAQAGPIYPEDYYEGAPGTHRTDPVDAPPGLADLPPGFEEADDDSSRSEGLSETPSAEPVSMAPPPVRPLGRSLVLPPVAHHQIGEPMEGHVKIAPPVRPTVGMDEPPVLQRVEEPPEWKPLDEPPEWKPIEEPPEWKPVEPSASTSPTPSREGVVEPPVAHPDELTEDDGGQPPGFEMDALDELEADMQLFGELDEVTGEIVTADDLTSEVLPGDDLQGEVLPGTDLPWEGEVSTSPIAAPGDEASPSAAAPSSLAGEALESAWQARPLSERLAAGSLLFFGAWAIWRIWSVF